MSIGRIPLSDEASAYRWTVVADPEAGRRECIDAWLELVMAGEYDWDPFRDRGKPPPWVVRPDLAVSEGIARRLRAEVDAAIESRGPVDEARALEVIEVEALWRSSLDGDWR